MEDAFSAHDELLATEGVFGREDEESFLLGRVDELEERVRWLGDDASAEELLAAVQSLREVRLRYAEVVKRRQRAKRPATAPRKRTVRAETTSSRPRSSRPMSSRAARPEKKDEAWTRPASSRTARSAKEKEETWTRKMVCTTPEPFSNLEADIRDRQRRALEEAARKRAEDEIEEKKKWPLVASYHHVGGFTMVEKHQEEQDQRAAARRALRLEAEARERDGATFKAKEFCGAKKDGPTWEEVYAEEEMKRSQRAQRRAESARRKQQAPSSARFAQPLLKSRASSLANEEEMEKKKKKKPAPEEVVKQLDEARERWRRALERAKVGGRSGTVPVDVFGKREAEAAQRSKEREHQKQIREDHRLEEERKQAEAIEAKRKKACSKTHDLATARQTYSSYLKTQAVRERLRRQREEADQEERVSKDRQKRLDDAGKRLARELRHSDQERKVRLETLLCEAASKKDAFRKQLTDNKQKLADVAKQAPSLMARLSLRTAKEKARAKALKQIANIVYGSADLDWNKVHMDMDIFDDDEKLLLNIHKGGLNNQDDEDDYDFD